ncbi:CRTAC1 family protein [Agaribacter marinus]|nr:CRTAC1 family protein [Agaribacter marinus]
MSFQVSKYSVIFPITLFILSGCQSASNTSVTETQTQFENVTDEVGLATPSGMKYGGPAVADMNHDGFYDLLLTDHDTNAPHLFWGNADYTFDKENFFKKADVHGMAPGDLDLDGDMDLLVSVGGGTGTQPKPPHLFLNQNGTFIDITKNSGIEDYGARGRSVKWVDLDSDGDLDFFEINAIQFVNREKPRNVVFENIGDGKFQYRKSPNFEHANAERALLTDYNNDDIIDVILFSPLSIWQGNNDFTFTDVSNEVLPPEHRHAELILAAAAPDIDNDGDIDLYLARGKVYSKIANNALDFTPDKKRFDLRDSGRNGHDGIEFVAGGNIKLLDFGHFPWKQKDPMPLYVGAEKVRFDSVEIERQFSPSDAAGFPEEIEEFGWFLGYLGDGKWRLEWKLFGNLAWDMRGSVEGVSEVLPRWAPVDYNNVPDILLKNEGGRFVDVSQTLPAESIYNNWGVTHGDFNNDGLTDLFIYRFGKLNTRLPDALFVNQGDGSFSAELNHGANAFEHGAHGDMGAAFDYNMDGAIDILSGDDEGRWHMFKNTMAIGDTNQYLLVRVGYSDEGVDPLAAKITVETDTFTLTKTVGSAGASFSQSTLSIAHFGLADVSTIKNLTVRWRDGNVKTYSNIDANRLFSVGVFPSAER